jgi:hypothetical protein
MAEAGFTAARMYTRSPQELSLRCHHGQMFHQTFRLVANEVAGQWATVAAAAEVGVVGELR